MRLTDNKDISQNLLDTNRVKVRATGTYNDMCRGRHFYFFTLHTKFFGEKSAEVLNNVRNRYTRLILCNIFEKQNDLPCMKYIVSDGKVENGGLTLEFETSMPNMNCDRAETLCEILSNELVRFDIDIERGNEVMYIKMHKCYEID